MSPAPSLPTSRTRADVLSNRGTRGSTIIPTRFGGDIGIRPLLSIPGALRDLGTDPAVVFERADVDLTLFEDAESRVPFEALGRLAEESAAATQCPHFGLWMGARFELSGLGAVGYLMRNAQSVDAALRSLVLHLHLHDRGAVADIERIDDHRTLFSYAIYHRNVPAIDILYDGAIAIAFRIVRALCGPDWKPSAVQLTRARPRDVRPYREFFGLLPSFNAAKSGVLIDATWLDRPIDGADPALHSLLTELIDGLEAQEPTPLTESVRRALRTMVMAGTASSDNVARIFSMSERSLRRRLQREGTSVHALLSETRLEVARQLLQTDLPLAEIAATLNYSEPSALSRAFRAWTGITPRQWRESARRRRR